MSNEKKEKDCNDISDKNRENIIKAVLLAIHGNISMESAVKYMDGILKNTVNGGR